MITDDYNEWRECLDSDRCELIASYMELIDAMVRDIQHLKAETIRARYELSQKFDPVQSQHASLRQYGLSTVRQHLL